ncbi:MAG: SGNH/GDSL hydrolase family protein [Pseudomonadota bacterium]
MLNTLIAKRCAVVALSVAMIAGPAQSADPITDNFTSFFVFGDSLSDNGNLFAATGNTTPQSPPYFDGRFSNGPVWNEQVIQSFSGLGVAANFAFGGAQATTDADPVPDFAAQVGLFQANIPGPALGDRPLASVWFGANDLFATIGTANQTSAALAAAENIRLNIEALNGLGINDFVVFNLPDLGQTPLFSSPIIIPDDTARAAASAAATLATNTFNEALREELLFLDDDGPFVFEEDAINIVTIDTNAIFNELLANPAAFGVSDTVTTCVISDDDGNIIQNCVADLGQQAADEANAERVFFDTVHPTQQIHSQLTTEFETTVAASVPLPAPAFLLLGALGFLVAQRRKLRAA